MAASEGVDLEWAIVYAFQTNPPPRSFSPKIQKQAKQCVEHVNKFAKGKKVEAWHSDDGNNPFGTAIYAKPEPKTDIVFKVGGKVYTTSVKMAGPVQLASGQGMSTAELFDAAAKRLGGRKSKVLFSIIQELMKMPTRLLSESNKTRIISEASPKVIEEFIKNGKIIQDRNYEAWLESNKPQLLNSMIQYMEEDKEFKESLIYEALTGEISLAKYDGAVANSIISPSGFYIIDDSYVKKIQNKIKFDIRGKSRKGITGVAFRIDVK